MTNAHNSSIDLERSEMFVRNMFDEPQKQEDRDTIVPTLIEAY